MAESIPLVAHADSNAVLIFSGCTISYYNSLLVIVVIFEIL